MAYEFVEAFSSVMPRVRITQILAALGILVDLAWRVAVSNFFGPAFVDIPAALLVGFYFGKRPSKPRTQAQERSKWIRLS